MFSMQEAIVGRKKEIDLKRDLKAVTNELAQLNRELANQTILLASQTGNTEPLIEAVEALRTARELYSVENAPRENAEVQQALADTLLTLAREKDDVKALMASIDAYRGAITLASMLGDEVMRQDLRKNYARARNLLGNRGKIRGAA